MAIKYDGDLNTLIRDLEHRGFHVESVKKMPGAPGRSADIYLSNAAIVRWDPYSSSVWADGALVAVRRVETYLRRLYEGGWFARLVALRRIRVGAMGHAAVGKALPIKSPAST